MTGAEVLVLMYTLRPIDSIKLAEALLYKKLRVLLLPMKRRLCAMMYTESSTIGRPKPLLGQGLIEREWNGVLPFFWYAVERGFENQDSSWAEQIVKS
jgi:hypothetical protein